MIQIQVVNRSTGRPVEGARVQISSNSWFNVGGPPTQRTGRDGTVTFDRDPSDFRTADVYVNGNTVMKNQALQGVMTIAI